MLALTHKSITLRMLLRLAADSCGLKCSFTFLPVHQKIRHENEEVKWCRREQSQLVVRRYPVTDVHTYIHTYTHTYIHTYTHTYIYIYTYTHTYIHTYTLT